MAKATASGTIEFTDKKTLLESLGVSSSKVRRSVMELAYSAHTQWVNAAIRRLHSSQREYIHALQPVKEEAGGASITLEGSFANMIENGTSAMDLRQSILNNVKPGAKPVKISPKVGRYRIIPMRRMTEGATGRNAPIMGAAYDAALGQEQSAVIRNLAQKFLQRSSVTMEKQNTFADAQTQQQYVRFQTLRSGKQIPRRLGGPLLKPNHTTGLYSGMSRVGGQRKGEPARYVMFRTISDGGKADWMQSISARNLVHDVERWISENAQSFLTEEITTSVTRS